MEQVGTRDQQWQVAIEWSPFSCRFDLKLARWERDEPSAAWALEDVWVTPLVHPEDLERQALVMLDKAFSEVELHTGRPVRGPF